jgi:hypothetical protein
MTELELQCYEKLAQDLYNKGRSYIEEGNACCEVVSVLYSIEELVKRIRRNFITALCEDLDQANNQCIETLKRFGGYNHVI